MHPQYRRKGIAKAFCEKALHELVNYEAITVTTYFRRIHCAVKREAVGCIIIPADVWADTCTAAHPAGVYGSDGCVAGSADIRVAYNGGGVTLSLSE